MLTLVKADSLKYKTVNSNERRTRLLPLSSRATKFFHQDLGRKNGFSCESKTSLESLVTRIHWV